MGVRADDAYCCCALLFAITFLIAITKWKLKRMAETPGYGEALANLSILGALTLYLDFVNLFLMLLRLLGKRK